MGVIFLGPRLLHDRVVVGNKACVCAVRHCSAVPSQCHFPVTPFLCIVWSRKTRKCVEQRRLNIDLTPLQEQSATCSALKAYTYLYSCIDTLFTAGKLYGAVT